MNQRRIRLIVDAGAPLARIDRELAALRAWAEELEPGATVFDVIVYGRRASWVPPGVALEGSTVARSVEATSEPDLGAALRLGKGLPAHATAILLAREPLPGWQDEASGGSPFRIAIALGGESIGVPAAIGQGHLGSAFRAEHADLALRWLACELRDRTWWCVCGKLRMLGRRRNCDACVSTEVPKTLEIQGRRVLLAPGVRLFPHHLGRPLAFDAPVARFDEVPFDGPIAIDGVDGLVGPTRTEPVRAKGPSEPALKARVDQCHACEGPLTPPIRYLPPDPRRYCHACTSAPHRCDFCDVPVGVRGGNVWPDGRAACRECWSSAVADASRLEALAEAGRAWMLEALKLDVPPCPVRFEHAAAIAALQGRSFDTTPGSKARVIGLYARKEAGGPVVLIEHGTPEALAYGVLVHELTHAWQDVHWPRSVARTLLEGLAMWVEYQALLAIGAIHAARHTERYGDPVYGLGFRIALEVERRHGADRVKDLLRAVTG